MPEPLPSAAISPVLPPAPERLVEGGAPRFGVWSGSVADCALGGLRDPWPRGLAKLLVEKKWVYALVASPEAFLCLAIVDAGILHSGFCAVLDRRSGALLLDENPVLPPLCASVADDPGAGLRARLTGPGVHVEVRSAGAGARAVRISGRWGRATLDLALDGVRAPAPLSACADLGGQRFDFTQKSPLLAASGEVIVGRQVLRFDGAPAGLDFTHGFLRRHTDWRWAFAAGESGGRPVAFNFSEGFLGSGHPENVVWLDGAPAPAGGVAFSFDPKDPRAPWFLRGAGVELEFTPEGQRAQDVDVLGLLASRYVQPFGTFRGFVTAPGGARVSIDGLAGVTEDHSATW